MLMMQLTEGQLQSLTSSKCVWIRCAAFLYARLGMHHDRYWDIMGEYLMDDEEFEPYRGRAKEDKMTVGQYVEQLLTKDKYCDTISLPRIPVAQRRLINKRMVLYGQFR